MNKYIVLTVALVWALIIASAATAQVVVSKGTGAALGVDLSGVTAAGAAAQTTRRTLENNLNRSGWMAVKTPGHVQVRGTIAESGGEISFACTVVDAAGQVYLNATYRQTVAQAIQLAHQVANDIVVKVTGKPTFFLARLAMLGVSNGAKELYISDSSGRVMQQVTRDGSAAVKPRWSPDNRFISYTSFVNRWSDVYTIELASGTRKQVSAFPGMNSGGAISPDGRSMALILSKDGNPDLYVMDMASKRTTRLTNTPRANEGSPAWSPDGSRIVFVSDASGTPQLYIISRTAGSTPQRLTQRGTQNVEPDWGANGLIAYQSLTGGKFQIAIIDPASGQERVITPYDAAYESPSWAPDGRHLAAARGVNYAYSIYLLDSEGGAPVALTGSGDWTAPAWSR
ncbi:MAG: hypothetical protein RBS84_00810 [Kiritimatiellia bacterium]|jgi:TolB protein|nr:hypothetical protein [Kiritimatiellia bacterium]